MKGGTPQKINASNKSAATRNIRDQENKVTNEDIKVETKFTIANKDRETESY